MKSSTVPGISIRSSRRSKVSALLTLSFFTFLNGLQRADKPLGLILGLGQMVLGSEKRNLIDEKIGLGLGRSPMI